jgi:RNA recognition motif-containing protein
MPIEAGKIKGFALIVFDSPAAAQRAISKFSNYEYGGRKLKVMESNLNNATQ